MSGLFENPEFWVLVAFVVFVAAVAKKGYVTITGLLDARADKIRDELDEAVRLREEAQNLLARHQRQQREAAAEAEAVLAQAEKEAERMIAEAETRIAEQLSRREVLAKQNLAQAEARALAEIRDVTVDVAIAATADLIAENLDEARSAALLDRSIDDLGPRLAAATDR
ncbi:MAG: F0F1 ATP synthase subunit B [Alphaproteobacteria bacterium]|jgi:F-type H+-transporting ATPase subunit b|nr:F0F1 ATP synthase subunit B [Alphaproteobacteria bacterium]MDP6517514.1 F0F1 ATP synthase subunit B [Alphaproteobacteria bacterium]